jgi:hypothetical protein
MITFTEFFLFMALIFTIVYIFLLKAELHKAKVLLNLILSNDGARDFFVGNFRNFVKQHEGAKRT